MNTTPPDCAEADVMKNLLLEVAQERNELRLLKIIVDRLRGLEDVALARIWLIRPGDICSTCPMRQECPDQTSCLHLTASAGNPVAEKDADWSRLDGNFRRFPIGIRKVGRVATSGEAFEIVDIQKDSRDIARPEWAEREGIRGFEGQPLVYKGEVLGVLGVFTRTPAVSKHLDWFRLLADHAASAMANASAFSEIERLKKQLQLENEYLREEVNEAHEFGAVVGSSPALRGIMRQVELVAPTDASVLILGESGTGKELVAREIHDRGDRRDGPMIKVNCPSIPRELYESEFFGHVRGAFTGALKDRAGRFEAADGGTLFLDEIGEIPLELQSRLLRVLQEGTYERVGEDRTRKVDVRIIAATNRDLKKESEQGRFREDLYYRLNVFPIDVAPLRKRKVDFGPLAMHFLEAALKKMNRPKARLTTAGLLELQQYDWPGNIRELQNVIERAVITSPAKQLRFDLAAPASSNQEDSLRSDDAEREVLTEKGMRRRDRDNIAAALRVTHWKIHGAGGAAELLGMKPTTLASRIQKMGIKRPR
jgi:transcriptional regulator with GAF, ATPase, and Fis domain